MRRREFLCGAAGSAALPILGWAQDRVPRVGVLDLGGRDPARVLANFREGLRRLGYVEGQTILIEFRSAGGRANVLREVAAELVNMPVDVVVAFQTPAALAAKHATASIPIVTVAGDPVSTGLVASLARPGGNVTGLSAATAEIGAKNVEIIREVLPNATRLSVIANASDPFHKPFLNYIDMGARRLGFEVAPILAAGAHELDAAFVKLPQLRPNAVVVQPSLPIRRAAELALAGRFPAVSPISDFPADGGLMSYAATPAALHFEAAVFVDKILRGRKPADLPVQQPTVFELVINLKTAKALELSVPASMLLRADRIIE